MHANVLHNAKDNTVALELFPYCAHLEQMSSCSLPPLHGMLAVTFCLEGTEQDDFPHAEMLNGVRSPCLITQCLSAKMAVMSVIVFLRGISKKQIGFLDFVIKERHWILFHAFVFLTCFLNV